MQWHGQYNLTLYIMLLYIFISKLTIFSLNSYFNPPDLKKHTSQQKNQSLSFQPLSNPLKRVCSLALSSTWIRFTFKGQFCEIVLVWILWTMINISYHWPHKDEPISIGGNGPRQVPELPILAWKDHLLLPQHQLLQSSLLRREERGHHRCHLHHPLQRLNLQKDSRRNSLQDQQSPSVFTQRSHQTIQQTKERFELLQWRRRFPSGVRTTQKKWYLRTPKDQIQQTFPPKAAAAGGSTHRTRSSPQCSLEWGFKTEKCS